MREILFKGFHPCKDGQEKVYVNGEWVTGKWVEGYYFEEACSFIKQKSSSVFTRTYLVIPGTVSEFTGMHEFVITDKAFNKNIFENDIVEVNSRRHITTEYSYISKSQYDKPVVARAVIKFKCGCWMLDYENLYNEKLSELKGSEQNERTVASYQELYTFCHFDTDWNREHNKHSIWQDIRVVGNVWSNPELLEVSDEKVR